MNIYTLGLFTKSILTFEVEGEIIQLICQLDQTGGSSLREEIGTLEPTISYEGHLITPQNLPSNLADGSIGEGVINGEQIRVQLLKSPQPSINLARRIFGDRLRVKKLVMSEFG